MNLQEMKDVVSAFLVKYWRIPREAVDGLLVHCAEPSQAERILFADMGTLQPTQVEVTGLEAADMCFDMHVEQMADNSGRCEVVMQFGDICKNIVCANKALAAYAKTEWGSWLVAPKTIRDEREALSLVYKFDAFDVKEFREGLLKVFRVMQNGNFTKTIVKTLKYFE